ncbi:hypothetical protein SCANM63S_05851 [Streptomyces canarius]
MYSLQRGEEVASHTASFGDLGAALERHGDCQLTVGRRALALISGSTGHRSPHFRSVTSYPPLVPRKFGATHIRSLHGAWPRGCAGCRTGIARTAGWSSSASRRLTSAAPRPSPGAHGVGLAPCTPPGTPLLGSFRRGTPPQRLDLRSLVLRSRSRSFQSRRSSSGRTGRCWHRHGRRSARVFAPFSPMPSPLAPSSSPAPPSGRTVNRFWANSPQRQNSPVCDPTHGLRRMRRFPVRIPSPCPTSQCRLRTARARQLETLPKLCTNQVVQAGGFPQIPTQGSRDDGDGVPTRIARPSPGVGCLTAAAVRQSAEGR